MNPFLIDNPMFRPDVALGLSQIKDEKMPSTFQDSMGSQWRLVKDAFNAAVGVPDPTAVQFQSWWCKEHARYKGIYCYCAQGVLHPTNGLGRPTQLAYVWFGTKADEGFTPAHVSRDEWTRAHVYASDLADTRTSMFNAFCGVQDQASQAQPIPESALISVPRAAT